MKLIAILTFFSIIKLLARISTCPLVLGYRGAPGIYPEDSTVILTKFLFNYENTSSSDQIPKPESTNPDFLKVNLLFVLINRKCLRIEIDKKKLMTSLFFLIKKHNLPLIFVFCSSISIK